MKQNGYQIVHEISKDWVKKINKSVSKKFTNQNKRALKIFGKKTPYGYLDKNDPRKQFIDTGSFSEE